jgi:hypothetical protein
MPASKLEFRLEKLETKTARPGELLVIWRRPGTDIRTAIAGQRFANGDKVICPEWTGMLNCRRRNGIATGCRCR